MGPVREVMQNLPPLLSTIHEQTGISPPSWVAQMSGPEANGEPLVTKKAEIANHT